MMKRIVLCIATFGLFACGERTGVETSFEPAPAAQPTSEYETPTVDGQGWESQDNLGQGGDDTPMTPPMRDSDLGKVCRAPDDCDSDSPDWPDCLNSNCDEDCSLPILGGSGFAGYCTQSCRFDYQCQVAESGGAYGDEYVCLGDGVNGVCAPGTNARCDGARNGQCARDDESCKLALIYAPDTSYGAVCQPSTPDGAGVGERCDAESGVSCANDLCMFDGENSYGTCISFCDPEASTSICPRGFSCFDNWYAFGVDSGIELDMCLPTPCEADSDCEDDFFCGLSYEFNSETVLRGYCLPRQEGAARNGDPCSEDTVCEGATCFGADTDTGYCSGLCDDNTDCPDGFSCGIVNFGISADPGSAPAMLCQRLSGSEDDCRTDADCGENEACSFTTDGDLENGRPVEPLIVTGKCFEKPENAVGAGEECGDENPCGVENFCLRAGGQSFCATACTTSADCADIYGLESSLCFGIGISESDSAGVCVPSEALGMSGSFTACGSSEDCTEPNEYCGFNLLGTFEPRVETLCMGDPGGAEAGTACTVAEECQSGYCSVGADGTGLCSSVCVSDSDCVDGTTCELTNVGTDYIAETTMCVVSADANINTTRCGADEYVSGNACMACPAGTANEAGDDSTGADTQCDDVDECATANGGCAADATCTNAEVSGDAPSCVCNEGFFGDGLGCAALTECTADEFETLAATTTSDRTCSPLTVCLADEYESVTATATTDRSCMPLKACAEGEYEMTAPTATTDRECAAVTECTADEYESAAPTATTDRVCTALTACAEGEFENTAATATTDRECKALSAECGEGFFESVAPTATNDRVCTETTAGCVDGEFEAAAPTATSDRVCTAFTVCTADEYETAAPTATSDRECMALTVCAEGEYESVPATATADRSCMAITECTASEYQTAEPTANSDRGCAAISTCTGDEYETAAPTATSDRGCMALTECTADQYMVRAPTAFSDRQCEALTVCTTEQYQTVAATGASDRVCEDLTICTNAQYQTVAPTATSDRECMDLTVCSADQYEFTAPTATTDRECVPVSGACVAPYEYESAAPTATSDRVCTSTTACTNNEYEVAEPTSTTDRVCETITVCGAGEQQVTPPTDTSDRVCEDIDECQDGNNGGCLPLETCTNAVNSGDPAECSCDLADDADCDGVVTADDCNDNDNTDAAFSGDCDDDGVATTLDCNDSDAAVGAAAEGQSCDGLCLADYSVVSNVCTPCAGGTTNAAGDDPAAGDTACD